MINKTTINREQGTGNREQNNSSPSPTRGTSDVWERGSGGKGLKRAISLTILFLFVLTGCNKAPEQENSTPKSTQSTETPPVVKPTETDTNSEAAQADTLKKDVETALSENKSGTFPKGVKLNSAEIKDSVLTLDFDSGFNQVANRGDSGESDVQKELMQIASGYGAVKKMRVTVNGKPFESQATDWNTPFSVNANPAASKVGQ